MYSKSSQVKLLGKMTFLGHKQSLIVDNFVVGKLDRSEERHSVSITVHNLKRC